MIGRPILSNALIILVSILFFGFLSGQEYQPRGKRDPFLRNVQPQVKPSPKAARKAPERPPGLAGLYISEVVVVGTAQKADTVAVILKGPNDFSYVVRPGAKLVDGYLKSASAGQVVFAQKHPTSGREKWVTRHLGK